MDGFASASRLFPASMFVNGTTETALLLLLPPLFVLPLPPMLLPLLMKASKTGEQVFGSHRITIQPDSATLYVLCFASKIKNET